MGAQGGAGKEHAGRPRIAGVSPRVKADYSGGMSTARYVYWRDGEHWLGYFGEFPDYMTEGESLEDLQENLKDLYRDLTSGELPGVRRAAELSVP